MLRQRLGVDVLLLLTTLIVFNSVVIYSHPESTILHNIHRKFAFLPLSIPSFWKGSEIIEKDIIQFTHNEKTTKENNHSNINLRKDKILLTSSHYQSIWNLNGGSISSDDTITSISNLNDHHSLGGENNEEEQVNHTMNQNRNSTVFVFSDVDGTLVHYPKHNNNPNSNHDSTTTITTTNESSENVNHQDTKNQSEKNSIIHLPPSSTGMKGIISSKTLLLSQELRRTHDVKFILVSGMRTSTLLKRLPYLPKADAYASEAGGRIFYPRPILDPQQQEQQSLEENKFVIHPIQFDGAQDVDLEPFYIEEDLEWRKVMSRVEASGMDGYEVDGSSSNIPLEKRKGALWDFANKLVDQGLILDYNGYACCFRVNKKHQTQEVQNDESHIFQSLQEINVTSLGLGRSVNLGCVDFYPIHSGKRNCCAYLIHKMSNDNNHDNNITSTNSTDFDIIGTLSSGIQMLSQRALCICDDDNDIEMALACRKAFLPSISSETMIQAVNANPNNLIVMKVGKDVSDGYDHTVASEEALTCVIEELQR